MLKNRINEKQLFRLIVEIKIFVMCNDETYVTRRMNKVLKSFDLINNSWWILKSFCTERYDIIIRKFQQQLRRKWRKINTYNHITVKRIFS